jgi:acyl dehydratase/NAD(P)-dependent dehydrogenase (short-subunit alcohol dehydrogenase family)
MNVAKILSANDMTIGREDFFEEIITAEKIAEFSKVSGDLNPLHNDPNFAKEMGKPDIVAHGAIQQYLISRFAGMYLPGKFCILKKIETNYLAPVYPGRKITIHGVIKQFSHKNIDGELEIKIYCSKDSTLFSITRVRFGLTEENSKNVPIFSTATTFHEPNEKKTNSKKRILLLGGSGGLGQSLKSIFESKNEYDVFISGRNVPVPHLNYDPLEDGNGHILTDYCQTNSIHSVIFLASKMPPKQSLTEFNIDNFLENIKLHFKPLRDLGASIKNGQNSQLKRIVMIGSSGSREHFFEYGFESYAYTKLLAKLYIQDLSRELARVENLTLNLISPSELATGMNANLSERAKQMVGAKLPTGTMVTVEEVYNAVFLLLKDESSMIKGQEILISGGKVK